MALHSIYLFYLGTDRYFDMHLGALESWLITLSPLKRRIVYVIVFEIIAIISSTFVLMKLSNSDAADSLPVAMMISLAAIIWNFVYNTAFETWEERRQIAERTLLIRSVHALIFEIGLVLICLPLYMFWYQVGLLQAFIMEAALLVFFLIYNFVFTFIFDKVFTLPYHYKSASAS
ncbi:PACE efflux transporter [Psychrobacter glaciei]